MAAPPKSRTAARKRQGVPPVQAAVVTLLRTADRVRAFIDSVVAPYGITGQQYNVLRILRGAEPEGLPTLTIASRMIERAPGITRIIDRLEGRKLVARERRPGDRRQVYCRITHKGLELVSRLDEPIQEGNKAAVSALGSKELALFTRLLERVLAGHDSRQSS